MSVELLERVRSLGVAVLGGLNGGALETLTRYASVKSVTGATNVYVAGDPARSLFVVLDGTVRVSSGGASFEVRRGGSFGEQGLIDLRPRSHTAKVKRGVELLEITSSAMDALYRADPRSYALFVLNLARELSRRLRVLEGVDP